MEPQLQHPQVHRYGEDHHHRQNVTNLEGEAYDEQDHGDLKSALEKVKVKAKKIKETIKKHVHHHDHQLHDEEQKNGEYENIIEEDQGRQRPGSRGNLGKNKFEEAPLAPRNTPVTQYGQDLQEIANRTSPSSHAPPRISITQSKQSSYAGNITSALACKATKLKDMVTSKQGGGQNTNWAEKLKPGEEDTALSELISGTLYNKGGTPKSKAVKYNGKKPVSDAVHKQESKDDDDDACNKDREAMPMGKVTESEEVARRLGTSEEERRGEMNYVPTSTERAVADYIKEVVSSWWTAGSPHSDS